MTKEPAMQFQQFDSAEEMFAAMRQAEEAANDRTTDQQTRISFGDAWARPMGAAFDYIWVWGVVQTPAQLMASELYGVTEFRGVRTYEKAVRKAHDVLHHLNLHETDEQLGNDSLAKALRSDDPGILEGVIDRLRELTAGPDAVEGEAWEEFVSALHTTRDSYVRGYRFGKAWSPIEPRGEYGSTHVSEMVPLRQSEFDDARAVGWDFRRLSSMGSADRADWAVQMVIRGSAHLPRREV